jgi:hypothetical protein
VYIKEYIIELRYICLFICLGIKLLYKEYKFRVITNIINTHLYKEKHKDISKKERRKIIAEII